MKKDKLLFEWEQYQLKKEIKELQWYIAAISISTIILIVLLICTGAFADVVIETIAFEDSQNFESQVAIASVIKTRAIQRHKSFSEICLEPKQFSCWNKGKATQKRTLTVQELAKAKKAWGIATVGQYNHYCRWDVKPFWIKSAKSSKRIGNHIFYEL